MDSATGERTINYTLIGTWDRGRSLCIGGEDGQSFYVVSNDLLVALAGAAGLVKLGLDDFASRIPEATNTVADQEALEFAAYTYLHVPD